MREVKPNIKLQAAREQKTWTLAEAAEAVGVDVQTIWRWENGHQRPRAYALRKLAMVFGLTIEDLGFRQSSNDNALTPSDEEIMEEREEGQLPTSAVSESSALARLTSEQAAILLPLLKEGIMAHFDPKKRKTLEQIILALGMAAAAPHELSANTASWQHTLFASPATTISETTVDRFEKLTTLCWNLLKGNELATVDYLLPTFLPEVETLAQYASKHQTILAEYAAQGDMIAGIVATLQLNHVASEAYCKKAITFSRLAKNHTLEAAALKHLAVKYFDLKYPRKTLETYQEVLPFIDNVSPLMKSRTYLGLAAAYAQMSREQEALRYLGMAQETFPSSPVDDLSFVYADCGPSSLNHYGGLIYLELGQPQKAWETFAEVEALKHRIVIPERTIIEIGNCQAEAAVAQRDLELASSHIQRGVVGAQRLNSERRFADIFAVYKDMRLVWPNEPQVKALADLFQR